MIEVRVDWHPEAAEAAVAHAAHEAELAGARVALNHAQAEVPFLTGELRGSADIVELEGDAAVTYGAVYAPVLRKHAGDWHFRGGRSGRWLDDAFSDQVDDVGRAMEEALRSGWPG